MFYKFPVIKTIDDVLPYVKDDPSFIVKETPLYKIINYVVAGNDTFPPVTTPADAIRRECRGIAFYPDGTIMERKYHKFFNINEREETLAENVDFNEPHIILEKLDGSMITPMIIEGGCYWATKMGMTDVAWPVFRHVMKLRGSIKYEEFCLKCAEEGWTCIFEWCSRQQRIVIDYPDDRLILTAVRHTTEGHYLPYNIMKMMANHYEIPCVLPIYDSKVGDINSFIEKVRNYKEGEGCVIRFEKDGHMLKLKTDYYVAIHRAKDALSSERKIVAVILENGLDDLKAVLNTDDKQNVVDYETKFLQQYEQLYTQYQRHVAEANDVIRMSDRKNFAINFAPKLPQMLRGIVFAAIDGKSPQELFRNMYVKNVNNNKNFAELKKVCFSELTYKGSDAERVE